MDSGYTRKIRERIVDAENGTFFIASDFADIADTATIRQILEKWQNQGC